MAKSASNSLLLIVLTTLASGFAYGDGKFYRERVPVGVPYQRAVLLYEGGKETLILQSKYRTATPRDTNSIAWIVPVPSVPELASMDARDATYMFFWLGFRSGPRVIPILPIAILIVFVVAVSFLVSRILNRIFPELREKVSWLRITIGGLIGLLLILSMLMPSLGKTGVDVVKAETVGIYDVKVIAGNKAEAVIGWLKDNGFALGSEDDSVFKQYVKNGWCFVTAKVGKNIKLSKAISEGLPAPLILRFDSKQAIYPMALTGTAEGDTEVLIYVLSDHKMDCGGKLQLAFSGDVHNPLQRWQQFKVDPNTFFEGSIKQETWQMSKFRGILNPQQMKEDILFEKAKDCEPYKETKWW